MKKQRYYSFVIIYVYRTIKFCLHTEMEFTNKYKICIILLHKRGQKSNFRKGKDHIRIVQSGWWEEMQTERESWACWHWDRFSRVPPLPHSVLTVSDSSGHTNETKHSARARFKCRQAASRVAPCPKRWWHSLSALWRFSHPVRRPPAASMFIVCDRVTLRSKRSKSLKKN